jgi:hypothetical protein
MTIENRTVTLPIDADYEAETRRLVEEGWHIVPGTVPVAVFALQREAAPATMVFGTVAIDDNKVFILKPDGTPRE